MARRSKSAAKKEFHRVFKARIKSDFGRADPVQWLAEQLHSHISYVSRTLNGDTPRRYGDGRDMNFWSRLKQYLTPEEIAILEEMERLK